MLNCILKNTKVMYITSQKFGRTFSFNVFFTLRTEGQSVEKIDKPLNVFPSAVAKTIECYDETGSQEDCPRKRGLRVTSAALAGISLHQLFRVD